MLHTQESGKGLLRVIVRTANGTFPVADAVVTISGTDAENGNTGVLYSLRSDENGLTPSVELPTPPRSLSMLPGNAFPYARYRVEVVCDGYAGNVYDDVPVFDGVVSVQPVFLVPVFQGDTVPKIQITESAEGGEL